MKGKKGILGRTLTLIAVIIFVLLIMAAFVIYSSSIAVIKSSNDLPGSSYEIDKNSILFKSIEMGGNRSFVAEAIVDEYARKDGFFSAFMDELSKELQDIMKEDGAYSGRKSCLYMGINTITGSMLQERDSKQIALIKNESGDIKDIPGIMILNENYQGIEKFDHAYFNLSGKGLMIRSHYGGCL